MCSIYYKFEMLKIILIRQRSVTDKMPEIVVGYRFLKKRCKKNIFLQILIWLLIIVIYHE